MSSNLSVPIPIHRISSVEDNVADLHDRIAKNAYDRFLNRGATPGYELEDWLSAEADMIIKPMADCRIENKQVVVEIVVQDVDPSTLFISVTPRELLVFSGPDVAGRQVFRTVTFQKEIQPAGVEAEFVLDTLFVIAAVADVRGHSLEPVEAA